MSQRQLSLKLGRYSSFINKVLKGTRPMEYTEVLDTAKMLGFDARKVL